MCLTSFNCVYSQQKRLQFTQLTSDDGLSTSIITSVIQDHKGFMWIGTSDGLNRYDGFKFVVYKNNPGDSTSLGDNVIHTLFEDHNKNLLIGTENGLCQYDRRKDQFRNYLPDNSSPLKGIGCTISKIAEDSLGNLWLATTVGLIYFDRTNSKFIQFIHKSDNPESLSDNNVEAVLIDKSNRLWITTHRGFDMFISSNNTFKHFNLRLNSTGDLSNIVFKNLAEDHEGNIWIGSRSGLFCMRNNSDLRFIDVIHYQHDSKDKSSLSINQVNSLFVDDIGNVWIGTENGGLNLFDRKNNSFWHYRKDDNYTQSINNESIEAIYQDRSGNLWFGTYTGGLNIAIKNRDAIIRYQNHSGAPYSLSYNTVTSFLEDHNNQIWIGTDGGGLNHLNEQDTHFERFNVDNSNLSSNSVLCIIEDSKKQIWLGTWAGGLVSFDSKTGSFTSLTTKNSGIQDDNIYAVEEGYNNDLWLGSFEHGLIHYQIKENKYTFYTPENSGAGNEMIVKILKFSHKRLLLGTSQNFQIFFPDDNKFINFNYDPRDSNSLSYPRVTDILVENDSCVWIGTPEGLNRFNPNTKSFKRYFEKDGLPGNFIKGLIIDNSGTLWVTTNKGVSQFDYKKSHFKNFTKSDGLQGNEFSERGILKTLKGEILMGGRNGFNILFPDKIVENKCIPDVLITDFQIFNKSVKPGGKNSPLNQNITETKSLVLSHDYSVLTFSFASMDFSAPEKNQYAYKMDNFDKDWIYPGNKTEATYTNLNPGNYVFWVKGSNNDGIWNDKGTSIKITILPPWWAAWWFRFMLIFAVILIFAAFYLSRVRQLKNQKIILESTVALRTEELKESNASKDKFFSIIAHDLKNPFNTIIGFSELLKEEVNSVNQTKTMEFADIINDSAVSTFRLLENLLEWANSQQGNLVFSPVSINLGELMDEEVRMLTGISNKKNILLNCAHHGSLTIIADKNMLKTILRNLISNAIKFTHRNGIIEVKASIKNNSVEVSVTDNGTGMSEEIISKLFRIDENLSTCGTEDEKGTGLGLFLCKEFVEKHGGKIWAQSELGKGSVFKFVLPAMNNKMIENN